MKSRIYKFNTGNRKIKNEVFDLLKNFALSTGTYYQTRFLDISGFRHPEMSSPDNIKLLKEYDYVNLIQNGGAPRDTDTSRVKADFYTNSIWIRFEVQGDIQKGKCVLNGYIEVEYLQKDEEEEFKRYKIEFHANALKYLETGEKHVSAGNYPEEDGSLVSSAKTVMEGLLKLCADSVKSRLVDVGEFNRMLKSPELLNGGDSTLVPSCSHMDQLDCAEDNVVKVCGYGNSLGIPDGEYLDILDILNELYLLNERISEDKEVFSLETSYERLSTVLKRINEEVQSNEDYSRKLGEAIIKLISNGEAVEKLEKGFEMHSVNEMFSEDMQMLRQDISKKMLSGDLEDLLCKLSDGFIRLGWMDIMF